MSTKTTITGGALILVGGLALAVYANTNVPALAKAKATSISKYLLLSEQALKDGNAKDAEKFATQALLTDPKNKEALAGFKKVILSSCPKVAAVSTPAVSAPATPAPAATQPTQPAAEPEEEMGCI
jgi:hypothetical protein